MFGTALRLGICSAVAFLGSQPNWAGTLTPPCAGCVWSSDLPETPFRAVLSRRSLSVSSGARYGEFTFAGPKLATMLPLPSGVGEVAFDASEGAYYAMGLHGMNTLDLAARKLTPLLLPSSLPEFSWTMGIAFDQTRNRLVVATLGGTGYLYSYAPASDTWSILADLQGRDPTAIAFHPQTDRLYAITADGWSGQAFLEFTPDGSLVRSRPLDLSVIGSVQFGDFIDRAIQLVPVDEYLALVVPDVEDVPRMFVIDPSTAEMRRVVPIPEPAAYAIALTGLIFAASTVRRRGYRT